jgi:hypothetical protein
MLLLADHVRNGPLATGHQAAPGEEALDQPTDAPVSFSADETRKAPKVPAFATAPRGPRGNPLESFILVSEEAPLDTMTDEVLRGLLIPTCLAEPNPVCAPSGSAQCCSFLGVRVRVLFRARVGTTLPLAGQVTTGCVWPALGSALVKLRCDPATAVW